MYICEFVDLSSCQYVNLSMGLHVESWAGLLVALGASAVAICRAGLTCGGLGGITGRPGTLGYVGLGLQVEGWAGSLVALGASAVTICRAVCHEGLEETGGWMRRRRVRSGFYIEF